MKILFATQTYNRSTNGQGVFNVQLAEGLAQNGHEVLVLAPSEHGRQHKDVQKNGVSVDEIRSFSLEPFYHNVHITPFPTGQIRAALDEFQPQIIHIHDHYPLCKSTAEQANQRRVPLVATNVFLPDNITLNVRLFRFAHKGVNRLLWKMVLDVFNRAQLVTSPTQTALEIIRQQDIRVPLKAISCGIDLTRFHPNSTVNAGEVRERFGLDRQKMTFLYLGRLENEKRVDVLIRAFACLKRPDIQLAIAGKGLYAKALRHLAETLGTQNRIIFTGFVPAEDLVNLLNSVDYFCMPGDTELQSIATLEAAACGRPVLAADALALPELVKHKRNGYLFDSGDVQDAAAGIEWLANHHNRWEEMSAASLQIAAPHDLNNTIQQYEQVYQALVRLPLA